MIFSPATKQGKCLLVEDYVLSIIGDAGGEFSKQLMISKALYCMFKFLQSPLPLLLNEPSVYMIVAGVYMRVAIT